MFSNSNQNYNSLAVITEDHQICVFDTTGSNNDETIVKITGAGGNGFVPKCTVLKQLKTFVLQVNLFQKLTSTNPQYDKRLFIESPVQYMKIPSSEHVVYINCSGLSMQNKKQFLYTTCSELVVFMY